MSKMLLNEKPLLVGPQLAVLIGLNEAIILQQIQYWCSISKNTIHGRSWVYKTYEEWKNELPFISRRTIARTLKSLKEQNMIVVRQLSQDRSNHTIWYSINYEEVDLLKCQIGAAESAKVTLSDSAKVTPSLNEQRIHSENTTENKTMRARGGEAVDNLSAVPPIRLSPNKSFSVGEKEFEEFWELYPLKNDKKQAKVTFLRAKCHLSLPLILKSLHGQILEKSEKERLGLFCAPWKHPKTWLNGECWNNPVQSENELLRQAEVVRRSKLSARERVNRDGMDEVNRELAAMLVRRKAEEEAARRGDGLCA